MDLAKSPRTPALWVSITRYAEIYGITRPTVYKWLRCGLIESYKVDDVIRLRNCPPVNRRKS